MPREGPRRDEARRRRHEEQASGTLQRVARGQQGRHAARRWGSKQAELAALHALMAMAAITAQRVWRGHRGRTRARAARVEMAEFIAMLRLSEAAADEEEYWRTHPFARMRSLAVARLRRTLPHASPLASNRR